MEIKTWKFMAGAAGVALLSVLIGWWFNLMNFYTFLWGFVILSTYGGCLIILQVLSMRAAKDYEDKKGFEYCWRRTNELLTLMDNPDTLEWRGGLDRKSSLRSYSVNGKSKLFRAMYGRLVRAKQEVVVVFSIDDDDIWEFVSNPSPLKINDPFHDFEPSKDQKRLMMRPYDMRRGRTTMSRQPIPGYDQQGMSDNEFVENAFRGFDR